MPLPVKTVGRRSLLTYNRPLRRARVRATAKKTSAPSPKSAPTENATATGRLSSSTAFRTAATANTSQSRKNTEPTTATKRFCLLDDETRTGTQCPVCLNFKRPLMPQIASAAVIRNYREERRCWSTTTPSLRACRRSCSAPPVPRSGGAQESQLRRHGQDCRNATAKRRPRPRCRQPGPRSHRAHGPARQPR